jgi:transcriptional regulator with XRE-family HTH domain
MSIVSNNIKYLRRLNGLTQEQFARKIGIKRSLLGAYEEARANPNLTNLKNMAHAFGISVDNLLKNDLRKIRETPDLGLPFNPASYTPSSPLIQDKQPEVTPPQPLSAVIARFQPPKPTLRLVSRPITLKPLHQQSGSASPAPIGHSAEPMRFNNQFESSASARPSAYVEASPPQQTIQWVKASEVESYIQHHQNTSYLSRLPVFQLPTLPSGHYRAFEAGEDFPFPGALLVGSFVRNWYDIRDGVRYVFLLKGRGLVTRIAENQVKSQGTLLLKTDAGSYVDFNVSIKEVLEVWEIRAFISTTMPLPQPGSDKLKSLLSELRDQLNQTDLSVNFLA